MNSKKQPYTLIRTRRKTMALQVGSDLSVVVRAPLRAKAAHIDRFVAQHAAWIAAQQEKQRRRAEEHPPPTEEEWAALKAAAKSYIPPRVEHFAAHMGLAPAGVKITKAQTRFGSCSGKNSLCFSALLMRYPAAAIDYVVVHELAHIRHKNHGQAFYALVGRVLPDYKERRKLLKGI